MGWQTKVLARVPHVHVLAKAEARNADVNVGHGVVIFLTDRSIEASCNKCEHRIRLVGDCSLQHAPSAIVLVEPAHARQNISFQKVRYHDFYCATSVDARQEEATNLQ